MSEEIKDIRIVPESECCGCAACANACPVDAIRMDNQNSWEMLSDGSYVKDNSDHAEPLDSHTYLHHYFEKPFELPPAKLSLKERLFGRFHKN